MSRRRTWAIAIGLIFGFGIGTIYEVFEYSNGAVRVMLPLGQDPEINTAQSPTQIRKDVPTIPPTKKPEVKKVLLLTYMRGGSSVLGELFNQNEAASYWFEPVDGIYSDMYGTSHGWFPIDIHFNTAGALRYIGREEEDYIVEHLMNIFQCNIAALPVDVLSNFQMMHIQQKRNYDYVDCVNIQMKRTATKHPWACKAPLKKYCPRIFEIGKSPLESCDYLIKQYKATDMASVDKLKVKLPDNLANKTSVLDMLFANPFASHRRCVQRSKDVVDKYCTPGLQHVCDTSNIVAIKAIRLRADTVFRLMQEIPDLHVVYYVRDPRGIVTSRRGTKLLSAVAKSAGDKDQALSEAKLLCQRMSSDQSLMTKLDMLYPGQVMTLRYEDFVANVEPVAAKIYESFLNLTVPETLNNWLTGAPSGQNGTKPGRKTAGAFSTYRNDPESTARKWKSRLSPAQQSAISAVCKDVLNAFGYS